MKNDYEKKIKKLKLWYEALRKNTKKVNDEISKLIANKELTDETFEKVQKLTKEKRLLEDEQFTLLQEIHRLEVLSWKDGIVA